MIFEAISPSEITKEVNIEKRSPKTNHWGTTILNIWGDREES